MDVDGGLAKYSTNKAVAKYGTGYCDSVPTRHLVYQRRGASSSMFLSHVNVKGGTASANDANDANAGIARAAMKWISGRPILSLQPTPSIPTLFKTRLAAPTTSAAGTAAGSLSEIRRLRVEKRKTIQNAKSSVNAYADSWPGNPRNHGNRAALTHHVHSGLRGVSTWAMVAQCGD
ncbi:glycoside hydrolase family 7 protein [Ramaria rubella]|nr:glycoside hydrolase family 7 protein [Ramaria rubella]